MNLLPYTVTADVMFAEAAAVRANPRTTRSMAIRCDTAFILQRSSSPFAIHHRSSQSELPTQQDKWAEYALTTSRRLEIAFKANEKVCDVDNERFVNLDPQDMYQARKDAPDRRRMVRRGGDDKGDDDDGDGDENDDDDGDGDGDDDDDDDDDDGISGSAQEQDDGSDGSDSGELVLFDLTKLSSLCGDYTFITSQSACAWILVQVVTHQWPAQAAVVTTVHRSSSGSGVGSAPLSLCAPPDGVQAVCMRNCLHA